MEKILDAVENSLKELTDEFVNNPMRFFSEKDFHWYFCHLLNEKLIEKGFPNKSGLIETSFERNKKRYKTMIVHQEYGTVERRRKQVDVVVLDPVKVEKINDLDLKLNGEFLRPLAAIEFGTAKISDLPEHIKEDCQRLEKSRAEKMYIAIYYLDLTKSKEGSKKYQEHQQKMKAIKDKIEEASKKPRLKVIVIIHHGNEYEKYEDGGWPCLSVRDFPASEFSS